MLEGGPMAHMLLARGLPMSKTLKSQASMSQDEILFIRRQAVQSKYFIYLFENNYPELLKCAVEWFCIDDRCHVHAVVQSWYWFLSLAWKGSIGRAHINPLTQALIVPLLEHNYPERPFQPVAITTYLKRECVSVHLDANSQVIATPKLCACDTGVLNTDDLSQLLCSLHVLDQCSDSGSKLVRPLGKTEFKKFVTQGHKDNPILTYALAVAVAYMKDSRENFVEKVNKYMDSWELANVVLALDALINTEFVEIVRWMTTRLSSIPARSEFDSNELISKLKSLIHEHPCYVESLDNHFVNSITNEESLGVFWHVWSATPMAGSFMRPTCDKLGKRASLAGNCSPSVVKKKKVMFIH
jgi:hypothetical protein